MSSFDLNPPNGPGSRGHRFGGTFDERPGFAPLRWLGRAEDWLDERGKGAWIAATVAGFIVFWPVGLALLAYMIWSKRMFRGSCGRHGHSHRHPGHGMRYQGSGNSAFDAYRADTLRRLEEEQAAFEAFLKRLRDAKDKSEFDAFLEDRAARARSEQDNRPNPDGTPDAA